MNNLSLNVGISLYFTQCYIHFKSEKKILLCSFYIYILLYISCEYDVNFTACIGEKLDGLQKWMKRI